MNAERYAQAKRLFLQALDHEPPDREAFVRQACGDDEPLREEVCSLLRHHDTQTLLGTHQTDTRREGAREDRAAVRPRPMLSPGSWLERQLGPGGHLALGAGLAALVVLLVGYLANHLATQSIRQIRVGNLARLVDSNVRALDIWITLEKSRAETGARDSELRQLVAQLVNEARLAESADQLRGSPLHAAIREEVEESFQAGAKYAIWDRRYVTVGDWSPQLTGLNEGVTAYGASVLTQVFEGRTVLQMPGPRDPITKGYPILAGQPTIGVVTPVRDATGAVIAALLIHGIGAEQRFHGILSILELGATGEMYAFDQSGLMISESRFPERLKQLKLIPDEPQARSSLRVRICDPGGDLTRGHRLPDNHAALPLTRMARQATAGFDGFDAQGYADYRGVQVIGAWQWLDEHDFGVAAEVEYDEAFREFRYVQWIFNALYGLFALAVAGVVWSYLAVRRARRQLGEARRIGPYTLERLIGQGGMGQVYLARHALLKRPTAVKLLKPEVVNETTLRLFEREVQLASQLTHPNTIEIYDYGRTPENVFYCAMEYLPGITLEELVERFGPVPAARAVYLLRQACYSLREAHALGLIHRDIKPHNMIVCRRGGQADVVKVLDFGLAKDVTSGSSHATTASLGIAGTPLYMAPERLLDPQQVDARADIYALGAVAFKLLTGQDLFQAATPAALLIKSLECPADRPSQRFTDSASEAAPDAKLPTPSPAHSTSLAPAWPIPPALDDLVLACLAKLPDERPQSIDDVLRVLDAVEFPQPWGPREAEAWWQQLPPRP
ncbi:MAG: serine/threonine protein kinase [Pirellulaceae bacterium]|nr:serine/threonine protein kinase [Pirellulaceae bacterium]